MRTALSLLALASLTACGTDDLSAPTAAHAQAPRLVGQAPTLDLALTGGLTEADHVEVRPGVFVVRTLHERGEVSVLDLGAAREAELLDAAESGTTPPPPYPGTGEGGGGVDEGEEPTPGEEVGTTCYEYEYDNYTDSTRGRNLFGGNPSWYAVASALSYSDTTGPRPVRNDYVSTYLYTSAPTTVDYAYAYGYVYIEGRYVGYIDDQVNPGTSAVATGVWTVSCRERDSVTVEMQTYHYLYDGDQYLNIGDRVTATVACCP